MTDPASQAPQFSDDQMDQLLHTFYRMELPTELEQPPSSWPQIRQQSAASAQHEQTVSLVRPSAPPEHRRTSAARGLAVAGATLAACLTVIMLSTVGPGPDHSQTAGTKNLTPVVGDSDALMDVHQGGGGSGVVDDANTTLLEIEGVDLAPQRKTDNKAQDSAEQQ